MKAKHAREIRKGIIAAIQHSRDAFVILNSRYYSSLAVEAFNRYRWRHESWDVYE